ncbi:MAG TPA: alpha-L-arabinofuranosidase C-terminal domain-containing protein [Ignavibacteriaceae bacterium]|nr:alpha-L-arabinofuranosidase C-terminal domain-containing protein [Ignavibacteriaceae bacterium]
MKIFFLFISILLLSISAFAQQQNSLTIYPDSGIYIINKDIYGHFSEHLGSCIYGGIWVGENSSIPNINGIRKDLVEALRKIKIPVLRWPGGCFADGYHWKEGIGPKNQRAKMINTNWGGVTEDNSFGTHEFMNLCELIGCDAYISGNIGSGTVQEMSDWVEYLTSDAVSPMTELRKKNGRVIPWKVKYWGVGNENWGCGGIMTADYYASVMARYSWFLKNYGKNALYKVASGGLEADYNWTETLMKKWSEQGEWLKSYMNGYSLHYYTVTHNWEHKGSATEFNEDEWITTFSKALRIDTLISNHSAIMDKYDPQRRIGLSVDEWGNWHDVESGTNPAFLYQQNSLRDAISAALSLNIFNKHCGRVKMANIAQLVNVLQSLILTKDEKMILTPTYHVFDLYKVHQNATFLPFDLKTEDYEYNGKKIPDISATASRDSSGAIHVSLVNTNPGKDVKIYLRFNGIPDKKVTGQILTSDKMQDHNTFEEPNKVGIKEFKQFKVLGDQLEVELPSKSVIALEIVNK